MNEKETEIEFEEGSGNIYADLGLEDSDELFARAQIGFLVFKMLQDKGLQEREIARFLHITQADASHLVNAHFSCFTMDKLLHFLRRLGQKVLIQVSHHHVGEPYQQVAFCS